MNILQVTGKYLDQPILVEKFKQRVPYVLLGSAGIYSAYKIKKDSSEKKSVSTVFPLLLTALSAIAAPRIVNKLFKESPKTLNQIKGANDEIISKFLTEQRVGKQTEKILQKAKENVLSFKEVKSLYKDLSNNKSGKEFLDKLIPNPENIDSKTIFSEIGRLSLLGLIPVLGGITGGVLGDILTKNKWKSNLPNKIKEGAYQYLANIFLCNVGAGAALALMEKANIRSKSKRALGMVSGIMATGVIGGSVIANIIGNRIINPIFGERSDKNIYEERKPEALDIGLHTDDIATIAVMSGLKWIEPALPIMYSISGYRAGIGYRNVKNCNKKNEL